MSLDLLGSTLLLPFHDQSKVTSHRLTATRKHNQTFHASATLSGRHVCTHRQGCQTGFFKAKFPKSGFFKIWLTLENSFAFLALYWLLYMLKSSARKLHIILFLNHVPLTEMFFLVSYVRQYFCRQESGQEGANR
jgi:hypothetical protein